jgi:hypothetical protein
MAVSKPIPGPGQNSSGNDAAKQANQQANNAARDQTKQAQQSTQNPNPNQPQEDIPDNNQQAPNTDQLAKELGKSIASAITKQQQQPKQQNQQTIAATANVSQKMNSTKPSFESIVEKLLEGFADEDGSAYDFHRSDPNSNHWRSRLGQMQNKFYDLEKYALDLVAYMGKGTRRKIEVVNGLNVHLTHQKANEGFDDALDFTASIGSVTFEGYIADLNSCWLDAFNSKDNSPLSSPEITIRRPSIIRFAHNNGLFVRDEAGSAIIEETVGLTSQFIDVLYVIANRAKQAKQQPIIQQQLSTGSDY